MFMSAEVAQTGRAPDSMELIEGEAEDRAVAGSSPALGTTILNWHKADDTCLFSFSEQLSFFNIADIEVAAPISDKIEETGEIKCYTLLGGKMAKIIHKGPYDKCEPTYEKIFAWIKKNGRNIVGPTREVYLNDPREVGLEEALTEIYVPIK
jgi:effector-binding domain-containing protein